MRPLFFVRFLLALPGDPLGTSSALFEPVRKVFRLLLRLLNGPGMRGDWDSDAGRLVLEGTGPAGADNRIRASTTPPVNSHRTPYRAPPSWPRRSPTFSPTGPPHPSGDPSKPPTTQSAGRTPAARERGPGKAHSASGRDLRVVSTGNQR